MSLIELYDLKSTPDIVHEYTESLKQGSTPLVIDNGSYQCRVGWATNDNPLLVFRNLIAKPRKDRSKKEDVPVSPAVLIGNDIVNIEAMRFQLKTQFDRNVVTHFLNQEQIFDYIFQHLGIESENSSVPHPIVLTECFVNPNYSRQLMSELLFECYNVPSICYGVDSIFSFYHNQIGPNGLIVSCGYHTTHVIPILNGKVHGNKARRINLGGFHMIYYLHRLLQLKYPVHVNAITVSRIESLLHNNCSIATDYMEELRKWASLDYYEKHVQKIQMPYNVVTTTLLTAEQKTEKKRELAKRLSDLKAKKREETLAVDRRQLTRLLFGRDSYDSRKMKEFNAVLREFQLTNIDDLEKLIETFETKIEKATVQKPTTSTAVTEPPSLSYSFDDKLQPPPDVQVDDWLAKIKQNRLELLDRRQVRRQRKQDLSKRRTAAAQERMRIISQLARKEKGTDDFGMRDEDWDVYKVISKEAGDTDSEGENIKLLEYEEIIRHHCPNLEEFQLPVYMGGAAESHQLHVGVEAIRTPELLFQPSMIGSSEAGLAETIEFVLKMFTPEEQLILANNVLLTGGCSQFPGLSERLSTKLLETRPFQTPHNIFMSKAPVMDAWQGARDLASDGNFKDFQTTRADYEEHGGEYFRQHYASNKYFKTPAPIPPIETVESSNDIKI